MMKHIGSTIACLALIAACGTPESVDEPIGAISDLQNDIVATDTPEDDPQMVERDPTPLNVAFYNVENLFDTHDDPDTRDEDFLPTSEKIWTDDRYDDKLSKLSEVLSTLFASTSSNPDIIGLCEIENEAVVADLMKTGKLANTPYSIVHFESPDKRGIDVALAYNSDVFTLVEAEAIEIILPDIGTPNTRDVLYVHGKTAGNSDLHFFVNHWPSRREGQVESEPRRVHVAEMVKAKIDDIKAGDADANIFMMGDFNDYPNNISMTEAIGTDRGEMVNLALDLDNNNEGSYNYRGDWGMLDQFIVSPGIEAGTNGIGMRTEMQIFREDFVMFYDKKYDEYKPNKTYGGPNYYGGYSDHLAVYITLEIE